jgi:hypothetical protein
MFHHGNGGKFNFKTKFNNLIKGRYLEADLILNKCLGSLTGSLEEIL